VITNTGTPFCSVPGNLLFQLAQEVRSVLDMRRLHPECSDSKSSDRSLPADILLREEPEEEEDEDEDENDRKEDEDGDDGYSE
jgi:hypothetical protein